MQMPNINDQILNSGVDDEVIDAQVIDQPTKKKKMVRLLAILGFGLIAGGGYMMYTDQKPVQPVNPELQRILSGAEKHPPKAAPTPAQSVPTPPQTPDQQTISGKPEEPKPVAGAAATAPATLAQQTPVSTPSTVSAPAATQAKPPAAEVKPPVQPAQSEKEILLEKKVEHLIGTVEALKKQVAQLSQRATVAPALALTVAKTSTAAESKKTAAADLPVKTINLKESGILATTVNSLIVFYGGKNQEIFIGDAIPGMGEKLAGTNPHIREFTTNRAIYRPVN